MFEQVPLFAGLEKETLNRIEQRSIRKRYRARTVLIEQGDVANMLYVLVQGRVRVFLVGEDGKAVVLGEKGAGDCVGELALLVEGTRTASVETLEDCEFLTLTKVAFDELMQAHPEIAVALLRDLAKRFCVLSDSLGDFALLDVYGRIAKLIRAEVVEEGDRRVTGRLTHQDIADRVGASREMVSKILKDLRAGGYIEIVKKRIVLHRDLPARW